mmetsp:Transcript_15305/g.42262  ORF Transcript_15305/g.42262 Transcript_15305/m.42262 type:complete len:81 (+) Transcript_15305:113-355(+)
MRACDSVRGLYICGSASASFSTPNVHKKMRSYTHVFAKFAEGFLHRASCQPRSKKANERQVENSAWVPRLARMPSKVSYV